jgi:hypothetical protein
MEVRQPVQNLAAVIDVAHAFQVNDHVNRIDRRDLVRQVEQVLEENLVHLAPRRGVDAPRLLDASQALGSISANDLSS